MSFDYLFASQPPQPSLHLSPDALTNLKLLSQTSSAQLAKTCPDLFDLPFPSSDKALLARSTPWIFSWISSVRSESPNNFLCSVGMGR